MELLEFLKQLFVIAIGGSAALVFAFYLVWPKIEGYMLRMHSIGHHKVATQEQLQLRFAAYERLILLVHRISPQQVMLRNHESNQSVSQFRQRMIADLDQEFQHNFTQQLYVSDVAWSAVRELKNNTVSLLQNTSHGLENRPTDEYIATVLRHVKELDVNPYDAVQVILKKELSI